MLAVVAIDGPVGVGKSTTAKRVAQGLGLRHIDTGSMYRAVAWRVMQLSPSEQNDNARVAEVCRNLRLDMLRDGTLLADGHDISLAIRDEAISQFVARVADNMEVRRALVEEQRRLGAEQPSVLEGRDIGTVVFPDAACKIFLDASVQARVARRVAQLQAMNKPADPVAVHEALLERDARDRARPWGALRLADDAILIDTTHYSEDQAVEIICALVRENPGFSSRMTVSL